MSSSGGNPSFKTAAEESAPESATGSGAAAPKGTSQASNGTSTAEPLSLLQGHSSSITGVQIIKEPSDRGTPSTRKALALKVKTSDDISVRSAPAATTGTDISNLKTSSKKPFRNLKVNNTTTFRNLKVNNRKALKIPSPRNFIHAALNETHTAAAGKLGVQFTKGILKQMQYWDVQLHPISKHMIAGHLIPTVKGVFSRIISKPRRITLEWYETPTAEQEKQGPSDDHHNEQLFMKHHNEQTRTQVFQSQIDEIPSLDSYDFLDATDMLTFHIYKKKVEEEKSERRKEKESSRYRSANENSLHSYGIDDEDFSSARALEDRRFSFSSFNDDGDDLVSKDDDSTTVAGGGGGEDGFVNDDEDVGDGWTERYRVLFQDVDIVSDPYSSKVLDLELNHGKDTIVRGLEFPTFQQKMDFVHAYYHLKKLFQLRATRLAEDYKKDMQHQQQQQNKNYVKGAEHTFPTIKPKQAPPEKPAMTVINENEPVDIQCGPDVTVTCGPETNIPQIMNHIFGGQGFGGTAEKKLQYDNSPFNGNDINLLVEIVSASDLTIPTAAEYMGTKVGPYVKVFDGDEVLHRTKILSMSEDPIWTLSTGSFFLIRTSVEKFFQSNYLTFDVMLNSQMNNNPILGSVDIPKSELLKSTGERVQYELERAVSRKSVSDALNESRNGVGAVLDKLQLLSRTYKFKRKSFLAVRVKHASKEDVQFMIRYRRDRASGKSAIYAKETSVPPRYIANMHIMDRNKRYHSRLGVTQYRAKPYPDPERVAETTWMTKDYLEAEAEKLSTKWIETGSGTIGKLFVEVLGCDDIPNLDHDLTNNNLSDAYVCLTYEDCVANTDVISNCLKPRWMPWTQRAFVLRMNHPSSQLFLGVFDHDYIGTDDFIGRAVINVSNFRPNTTYRLKYHLHALIKNTRTYRGSVTVRIRISFDNERRALIAGMLPPAKTIDLNVASRKNFRTVNFTLANEQNPNMLRLRTIVAYIQELQSYRNIELVFFVEFFITLLFWRSHVHVPVRIPTYRKTSERTGERFLERWTKEVKLFLPVRSVIAFAWGIAISRNFELIPSCLVFVIGWAMTKSMTTARERPDPWKRPRSFLELFHVLIWNKTPDLPPIEEYENLEAIIDYQTTYEARTEAAEAAMESIVSEQQKIDSGAAWKDSKSMDLIGEDLDQDVTSRAKGALADLSLAPQPIKSILLPVQLMLHGYCVKMRVIKSILLWRDCYISFWVAIAIWMTSLVFALVPWTILLKRAFTFCVWVFLGPWMKLVDIFWYGPKHTNETPISDINEKYKARYKKLLGESMAVRLEKEAALKNQDMRAYMFGRYLLRVPYLKEELHHDDPTSASSARTLTKEEAACVRRPNVFERKEGQVLEGTMIPKRVLSTSVETKNSMDSKFHKKKKV